MKIFVDECVYQATVDTLSEGEFSVITVQDVGLAGYKNGDVLKYAQQHDCVFLTRDKDFTDIRIYPPSAFSGIIVLKIAPHNQQDVHKMLQQLLHDVSLHALCGKLAIVDRKKYRVIE
jgi:predicted nuclease of predicted toxin-antitoxin system